MYPHLENGGSTLGLLDVQARKQCAACVLISVKLLRRQSVNCSVRGRTGVAKRRAVSVMKAGWNDGDVTVVNRGLVSVSSAHVTGLAISSDAAAAVIADPSFVHKSLSVSAPAVGRSLTELTRLPSVAWLTRAINDEPIIQCSGRHGFVRQKRVKMTF